MSRWEAFLAGLRHVLLGDPLPEIDYSPDAQLQRLDARLRDVDPCWAVLAHGKDAPEDEGWYFTWDDVTWATPHAFRVTLARTDHPADPAMHPNEARRVPPWIPLGEEWCDDCDGHGHHWPWCGRDD